jgi:carbon-monoxide dehydrogenase medium subunit
VPAEDFLQGYFTTALEPDEIVTAVRFPAPVERAAMQEFARRHGDFALVAVAVALADEPRIVLGGVADVPVRAREAERLLADGGSAEAAAQAAAEEIDPGGDLHASPDYRRRLAATLVRRALEEASGNGR